MTVVDDFAADYFVSEGLTPKRQLAVRLALRRLEEHAGAAPETLDDLALRAYVTHCVSIGMHVNTARRELHAIKPFYRWCWRQRIVDADRYMRIREVKPPRGATGHGRPRPYKRKEIARFWTELDARYPLTSERMIGRYVKGTSRYPRVANHAICLQTRAIASLALFAGLRSAEIRFAPIDAIHPDNEFIVVRGKSPVGEQQGYREVPYTVEGRTMVAEWLAFRELLGPDHQSPWLVLNSRASRNNAIAPSHPLDPISGDGWERVLTNVGDWHLHRMRHTCATEWLRTGEMEIQELSRLLGHANISQTLCYAEIVREDVARSMRRGEQNFAAAIGRHAA